MMRYFCTYFDRNYLIKALAMIESLKRHSGSAFHMFALCMDEISRVILRRLAPPHVTPVAMHEIENGDEALLTAKHNRSMVEYYWTSTPTVILRLLERNLAADILTYVDADLFFYSSPQPIFYELSSGSVLIHEHRFPPGEKDKSAFSGRFNVGLMSFRRCEEAFRILKWWRERCNEWCYARPEAGKFGDQAYLDAWPHKFSGVAICENKGVGVAPWNHERYAFSAGPDGVPCVDGAPVVFYHFHNFKTVTPDLVIPITSVEYPLSLDILRLCVVPYVNGLLDAAKQVVRVMPQFSCGFWQAAGGPPGVSVDQTFVVSKAVDSHFSELGLPQRRIELNDMWCCYASERQTPEVFGTYAAGINLGRV